MDKFAQVDFEWALEGMVSWSPNCWVSSKAFWFLTIWELLLFFPFLYFFFFFEWSLKLLQVHKEVRKWSFQFDVCDCKGKYNFSLCFPSYGELLISVTNFNLVFGIVYREQATLLQSTRSKNAQQWSVDGWLITFSNSMYLPSLKYLMVQQRCDKFFFFLCGENGLFCVLGKWSTIMFKSS